MRPRRILFISNLFPNPLEPHRAAFSRNQIAALSELAAVDVIAPIAWSIHGRRLIPQFHSYLGCDVYHPTYWYTPGVFRTMYGRFYLASIRSVARHLLTSRHYDLIFASWLFPDGWAAARLSREFNIPFFQNVVGTDANRLTLTSLLTKKSLSVLWHARKTFVVSQALKTHLVNLGANAKQIEVVYNGVDRTIFYPMNRADVRKQLSIPQNVHLILFVGNLKREKGVLELAKAFALLAKRNEPSELRLVIIGDGPFKHEMENILTNEGVEKHAHFLGVQAQHVIAQWMNVCDVFCLPSYSEGQPNVLIEAMACRAHIVATRVGGIPELSQDYSSFLLVDPGSVEQLLIALDNMLKHEYNPVGSNTICSWQENAACLMRSFEAALEMV